MARRFLIVSVVFCFIPALLSGYVHGTQSPQKTPPQSPTKKPRPVPPKLSSHVILISISGLRSDYLSDQHKNEMALPTLRALREKGALAEGVESVYPSLNCPAHATMATGMLPADHGITSDFPFDEQSGGHLKTRHSLASEIKSEPVWDAAQRAGLVTAAAGFPLTSGAKINFNEPKTLAEPHGSDEKEKKKSLLINAVSADQTSAMVAASIIEKNHPNLLLVSFDSLDEVHHQYGPFTKESATALARIDGLVRQIIDSCERVGIIGETTFLIVAPYGSAKIESEFSPNVVLAKKKLLTRDEQGRIVSWQAVAQSLGGAAAIIIKDPGDEKTLREAEAAFKEIFEKPYSPIWRILPRRDVSRLGADARAAFYLDAAPLFVMSDRASGEVKSKSENRGATGYLPQRFEMRGTLIVSGKGIRPGAKVEYARLIDLAPTIARLLGCEMKATRGRIISEMLAQ